MRKRFGEEQMTADEMQRRNVATMGEALGKQYTVLFREVSALHLYWKEFLQLFGPNQKRIDRLNQTAPGFFRMLKMQQFETNMLHLARFTDKSTTAGKTNLTVLNLPSLVADAGLKDELAHLVEEAKKRTEFCRDWRNREFAHQESVRKHHAGLHSFRSMRRMEARRRKASALRLRHSQSLASLRQRPSQARVRSTIQRLGRTTKPLA